MLIVWDEKTIEYFNAVKSAGLNRVEDVVCGLNTPSWTKYEISKSRDLDRIYSTQK